MSNTSGSGFLDSTAQSQVIRTSVFYTKWNFISKIGISFLKTDRGAGFEASPGFPTPFSISQFGEEGKYLNPRENYGIIKRKVGIGEGYEIYLIYASNE